MSDTELERLRVFCDKCVPTFKASTMEPTQIISISPAGDQSAMDGYVCPACGRQYTKLFGYRDKLPDTPRERLLVLCVCGGERSAMYIDQVRDDGGVGFRCWRCGATKEAESPGAVRG